MVSVSRRAATALVCVAIAATPVSVSAQSAPALVGAAAPAAPAHKLKIPEGTEMIIRFEDKLSSGSNTEGDSFSISLDDSVKLSDGTVLKPGYRGRGEVISAKKKGFMGQAGELNVRLNYIRVGDSRIRLRASKGGEGRGAMGATVALTVLFGPLGLLKRGHDIEIKQGQQLTAYVDQDAEIDLPVAPPPEVD
jgi:hypothetical protein